MDEKNNSNKGQVVIQEKIEKAMSEEFEKLLKENKQDKLLQLIIENKIDDLDLVELKIFLSED